MTSAIRNVLDYACYFGHYRVVWKNTFLSHGGFKHEGQVLRAERMAPTYLIFSVFRAAQAGRRQERLRGQARELRLSSAA